jgi:2-dehydro-3-deoxyphosphogluconate aldolase/(4S)-4-hydroxy-2-oxoglutarate aldolase
MADRETTINEILRRRVSAIVRTDDRQLAADAMQAAIDGGFTLVEFTLTTPGAVDLIAQFAERRGLVVGAGTVLRIEQAREAVQAGARFLVSPVCDPKIITEALSLGVVAIPGTFTATEMEAAHRAGADFVKLFPAPDDLPGYIASILGPLPHLRIIPTNGLTLENVREVLQAGAAAVAFTQALFHPNWLAQQDFDAIRKRASAIMRRVSAET